MKLEKIDAKNKMSYKIKKYSKKILIYTWHLIYDMLNITLEVYKKIIDKKIYIGFYFLE